MSYLFIKDLVGNIKIEHYFAIL